MRSLIDIQVCSKALSEYKIQVHPQMTTQELCALLLAAKILHLQHQNTSIIKHQPAGLLSSCSNILLDYMVLSQQFTMQQLNIVNEIFQSQKSILKHQNHHQTYSNLIKSPIQLKIIYKTPKQQQNLCSDIQKMYLKQRIRKHQENMKRIGQNNLQISHYIERNQDGLKILQNHMIHKSQIGSYDDIEKINLMKQKLIRYSIHNHDLFGQFKAIEQIKQHIIFKFKYIPQLSLNSIFSLKYPKKRQQEIIQRVYNFLNDMKFNNYSALLHQSIKNETISHIIQRIKYTIQGKLCLKDLNLLIFQGQNVAMPNSHNFDEQLFNQIRNYISNHIKSRQKQHISVLLMQQETDKYKMLSLKEFAFLYYQENHQYMPSIKRQNFKPKTSCYTFDIQESQRQNSEINIFQKSTNKKNKAKQQNYQTFINRETKSQPKKLFSSDKSLSVVTKKPKKKAYLL